MRHSVRESGESVCQCRVIKLLAFFQQLIDKIMSYEKQMWDFTKPCAFVIAVLIYCLIIIPISIHFFMIGGLMLCWAHFTQKYADKWIR